MRDRRPLVIGLGSDSRGDDAFGHLVVRKLAKAASDSCRVMEISAASPNLFRVWEGLDLVFVVATIDSSCRAGTIHRIDAAVDPIRIEEFFHYSVYSYGLGETILLAKAIGKMPRQLIVYAIDAKDFSFGDHMDPEVNAVVNTVARRIAAELTDYRWKSRSAAQTTSRTPALLASTSQ